MVICVLQTAALVKLGSNNEGMVLHNEHPLAEQVTDGESLVFDVSMTD